MRYKKLFLKSNIEHTPQNVRDDVYAIGGLLNKYTDVRGVLYFRDPSKNRYIAKNIRHVSLLRDKYMSFYIDSYGAMTFIPSDDRANDDVSLFVVYGDDHII